MVALPDVQEKAAGHAAAVEGHRQPDSGQLFGLHGPAQREQHTELGLCGVEMLHLPHRLPPGHGDVLGPGQRGAVDGRKLRQKGVLHGGGAGLVAAQHDELDVRRPQHLVVCLGQRFGRQAVHLF